MKHSRRSFISVAALFATALSGAAHAQYGGRSHERSDAGSTRAFRRGDANSRSTTQSADPAAALERELPSLRIDLKLTADQGPLFDSFEREVRNAAEAGRLRARHLAAFRIDETGTATADSVLGTIVGDDSRRAEATRLALERMTALYAALTPDQRAQFDRRVLQSLREPLGTS